MGRNAVKNFNYGRDSDVGELFQNENKCAAAGREWVPALGESGRVTERVWRGGSRSQCGQEPAELAKSMGGVERLPGSAGLARSGFRGVSASPPSPGTVHHSDDLRSQRHSGSRRCTQPPSPLPRALPGARSRCPGVVYSLSSLLSPCNWLDIFLSFFIFSERERERQRQTGPTSMVSILQ